MIPGTQKLLQEALALPDEERAKLAASLIDSLDAEADSDIEAAWRAEVTRRVEQLERGSVKTISWEEVRRSLLR